MLGFKKREVFHDKRKKFTIILDTETAPMYIEMDKPKRKTNFKSKDDIYNFVDGSIQEYEYKGKTRYSALITHYCKQVIFDIGYTISSIDGKEIYVKRNYLVDEIFTSIKIMKNAFYFEKYPNYLRMLSDGKVKLKQWYKIKQQLESDIINYRIETIWAYNVNFDTGAINETNKVILNTPFDLFTTYNVKIGCLWGWCCETILQSPRFIKTAINEGWLSDSGNVQTGAEVCYRYLTQNRDFKEEHTALSDSIIETHIYKVLRGQRKKYSFNLNIQPWALVRDRARAKGLLPVKDA